MLKINKGKLNITTGNIEGELKKITEKEGAEKKNKENEKEKEKDLNLSKVSPIKRR